MTEHQNRIVTTAEIEPGIHTISIAHLPGGINRLDRVTLEQFGEAVDELTDGARDVKGIVICSAVAGQFLAGADLAAVHATVDFSDRDIEAFCRMGRSSFQKLHQSGAVTVAAIDGLIENGGLELALWCDFRVAANTAATRLGFSDVAIGLLPAWGGSALLPRMTSVAAAAAGIATGKLWSVEAAFENGLVDKVVDAKSLTAAAIDLIRSHADNKAALNERRVAKAEPVKFDLENDASLRDELAQIAAGVGQSKEIYPYAPTVAIEHLLRTAGESLEDALESEMATIVQVYGSPANKGLLNHHFLVKRNSTSPGLVDLSLTPKRISKLGIVGAGVMGRSIAKVALASGVDVTLIDASQNSIAIAKQDLSAPEFTVPPGRKLEISDGYEGLANADLVIEAVVETIPVKQSVNEKIQAATGEGVLIASNTSSIPIEALASQFSSPERFCGIHFCHPEVMSLVEVIAGPGSSEQTVADAVGFVRQLGKMPIAINDGAGFVVNRMLAAMLNGALRLLVEGLTISQIDEAMCEFGFQAGPFEIIDIIGADTCMYAGRVMWEHGLSCVSLLPILPKLVKQNRLGRKTLIGFYLYPDYRAPPVVDPELASIVAKYQKPEIAPEIAKLSAADIALKILAPVVLEATRIIEEEVVNDFRDIELAFIHGLSFPQHRGGLLHWADDVGMDRIAKTLLRLTDSDPRMQPTDLLTAMRQEDRKFYS